MPGIRIESVGKHFGSVRAVDGVSLVIADGELVTLLGPSGCGKTTTLRMVAGLEQNDEGRIVIGDRVMSDPGAHVFVSPDRRAIGMVFQSYAIWPHMTVFENVAYPLTVRKRPRGEVRERVGEVLRLVEMETLAGRPAPMLSGGQQQRVAIARALVFRPTVLLMDEPLSNLDAKLREQMRVELRALQQRLGITTLYVTHDQEEAMLLSDRIAVMHGGRVLQVAAPEELYARPASRTVADFFGMPNLLDAKVRDLGREAGSRHVLVEGDGWEGWSACPESVQPGDSVVLVVRAEVLQVSAEVPRRTGPDVVWTGEVRQTFFRGSRRLLTVGAGGLCFNVDAPPDVGVSTGDRVCLRADASRLWVVPR